MKSIGAAVADPGFESGYCLHMLCTTPLKVDLSSCSRLFLTVLLYPYVLFDTSFKSKL